MPATGSLHWQEAHSRDTGHHDEDVDHGDDPGMVDEERHYAHGPAPGSVLVGSDFDGFGVGRDGGARADGRDAVDDHAVGRFEAGADDAQAVAEITDLDQLRGDHVVGADGQDDVVRLVGQDRGVRHQHGHRGGRYIDADAGEATGRQEAVGVRDGGAGMDGAARAVEGVVDE